MRLMPSPLTGLAAGSYTLTATAVDGSGLTSDLRCRSTSRSRAGSGQPYGLTNCAARAGLLQHAAGLHRRRCRLALANRRVSPTRPAMIPAAGLIPYAPNTAAVVGQRAQESATCPCPTTARLDAPTSKSGFAPTGAWTFPSGTVFVKKFELQTNLSDPNSLRRLETRLLVRDTNGAVYGVTYKWRAGQQRRRFAHQQPDRNHLHHQRRRGRLRQTWYYPSPADCLTCHTPVAKLCVGRQHAPAQRRIDLSRHRRHRQPVARRSNRARSVQSRLRRGGHHQFRSSSPALTNLNASLVSSAPVPIWTPIAPSAISPAAPASPSMPVTTRP